MLSCAALSVAITTIAVAIRLAAAVVAVTTVTVEAVKVVEAVEEVVVVMVLVAAAMAATAAAARGNVHCASCGCFRNPSASATQFARRRDPPRLGKLQTLACNL